MSLDIWTQGALWSEAKPGAGACWRIVEAQHRVSTLKLAGTAARQAVLEDILEETKPPVPAECAGLHYLLSSPFRYGAPYPQGSRFRRAGWTPGVFYASESERAAAAETAFHRLLFYAESPDTPLPENPAEFTSFSVAWKTERALDLAAPPLDEDAALWTDPVNYEPCQSLAGRAREADIGALLYASARMEGGRNAALLTCRAFARRTPRTWRSWRIYWRAETVSAAREHPRAQFDFALADFAGDPRVAAYLAR